MENTVQKLAPLHYLYWLISQHLSCKLAGWFNGQDVQEPAGGFFGRGFEPAKEQKQTLKSLEQAHFAPVFHFCCC
jgi:hypothetical protein